MSTLKVSARDGYVALPLELDGARGGGPRAVACPLSALGECGDANCSCYRLTRPNVRSRFRDLVRDAACERLGSARDALDRGVPVRYASIGSGLLLSDAEVLGALRADGFTLSSACVRAAAHAVRRSRRS